MHAEIDLDRWHDRYAGRVLDSKSSPVRDLMGAIAREDIISFAGGFPETSVFRPADLMLMAEQVLAKNGRQALQYGTSDGYHALKELICELMALEDMHIHSDEVLVTGGAQQALDLLAKTFIDPGDAVVVEEPSYVGAINSFSGYQAEFRTVPMDEDGLRTDLLEDALRAKPAPKLIYVVPNFHNPAGVTLSSERRDELLLLAERHDILVVEDNPYGHLRFEGDHISTMRSRNPNVIYLGTFSKIFSPGVRVGWVHAPKPILDKLLLAKQAADLCSSPLTQRLVEQFFHVADWGAHLARLNELYKERLAAMLDALERYFPEETSWTRPQGGFFVWATLPDYLDTTEMLADAIAHKVAYVPGTAFYPDGRGTNSLRLAFCYVEPDVIEQGIKELAKVVKGQISLYRSLQF